MKLSFESEAHMEECLVEYFNDLIYDSHEDELLFELNQDTEIYTQLDMAEYGYPDIVIFNKGMKHDGEIIRNPEIIILELKNREVKEKDFEQVAKYFTGMNLLLEKFGFSDDECFVTAYVIGTSTPHLFMNRFLNSDLIGYGFVEFDTLSGISINTGDSNANWVRSEFNYENLELSEMIKTLWIEENFKKDGKDAK